MDEFKRILKHSAIYGLGNVISKMIGFILIPVYTNVLSKAEYGLIELLNNTMIIIQLVVGMGLSIAILRFYSEDKDEDSRDAVITTSIIFTCFFALIVAAVGLYSSKDLSRLILRDIGYSEPFRVMMFVMLFTTIIEVPMVVLRAKERSITFLGVSLAQLIIGLVLNIFFIVFLRCGVAGWLLSSLWTSALICAYLLYTTLGGVRKMRFSFSLLKRMLAYTIPLIPASLAMFWIHNGDRYILNSEVGMGDVGIYSLGYRFAMMIPILVGQPFFLIWSVRMFHVFEQEGGEKVYARAFTYFTGVILLFWLCMAATIKEVIFLMSREQYHSAYFIVHIVAMGYVLREFSDFFKGVLLIRRRTSFIGLSTLISALVSTVLYLYLIPRFGQLGAAWATFFTFGSMALFMFITSQHVCRVPYEYKRLIIMGALAITILLSSRYVSLNNLYINMAIKGFFSLCFFPLLYLFGFFTPDEKEKIAKGLSIVFGFLK
ncbi:MAG: oligosaccharide flippase family protein [Planctomycetota bacterium]